MIRIVLMLLTFVWFVGLIPQADQSSLHCQPPIPYVGKEDVTAPVPYSPVSVANVAGEISGAIVGPPKGLPNVCIALFSGRSHKFIGSAITNAAGLFQFGDVPTGEYRLVVRTPGFFVAEIPIHVSNRSKGKGKTSKPIEVLLQSVALQSQE